MSEQLEPVEAVQDDRVAEVHVRARRVEAEVDVEGPALLQALAELPAHGGQELRVAEVGAARQDVELLLDLG